MLIDFVIIGGDTASEDDVLEGRKFHALITLMLLHAWVAATNAELDMKVFHIVTVPAIKFVAIDYIQLIISVMWRPDSVDGEPVAVDVHANDGFDATSINGLSKSIEGDYSC